MKKRWIQAVLAGALIWGWMPFGLSFARVDSASLGLPARVSGALTPAQSVALRRLEAESRSAPQVRIEQGVVRFLAVHLARASPASDPRAAADTFLDRYADLFDLGDPAHDLVYTGSRTDRDGNIYVRYTQTYRELEVLGSDLIVALTPDLRVTTVSAGYTPHPDLNVTPSTSKDQAYLGAIAVTGSSQEVDLISTKLGIYDPAVFGEPSDAARLVWSLVISVGGDVSTYAVHAHSGHLLAVFPELDLVRERQVWDAAGRSQQELKTAIDTGKLALVMDETGVLQEPVSGETEQLWKRIGDTYDAFASTFDRDSYDGTGAPLKVYVNVKMGCPNAAWSRELQAFLFCDGPEVGPDVVTHEFTHALIDTTAGLITVSDVASQSGALAESYADLFTAWADAQHPWIVSWDAEGKCVIRDLADPNRTPVCTPGLQVTTRKDYPATLAQQVRPGDELCRLTERDDGCAHVNSTIPSRAMYLLSEGSRRDHLSGIGREKTAQITYRALAFRLTRSATFLDARDTAWAACTSLIGSFEIAADDCAQVDPAFAAVGIREDHESVQ
jgi:Zn-dependent metalloprotease